MSKNKGIIIATLVVVVTVLFSWKYYVDNYQEKTAYAVVPTEVPDKTQVKDIHGKKVVGAFEYKYKFKFVLENGDKKNFEYSLSANNDNKPFTPKSIVKAKVAEKRISEGPNEVDTKDVPKKVLKKLNI